jgi:hypothetical protein
MRRITLLVVVVALVVTACDSGDDAADSAPDPEEELVEALTASAVANPNLDLDDETAACVTRGIVDEFGVDELAELGVTADTPDLGGGKALETPENGRRVVDVGMQCISLPEAIISFLPAGLDLLEDSVNCLAAGLEADNFRNILAAIIVAGGQPADILDNATTQIPLGLLVLGCLSPEEYLKIGEFLN